MHKRNVIWLASYPKSGNTWFRVFLTNLLNDSDAPANINDLAEASISSSRKIFDDYTGISSADLTNEEIDRLRPDVYRLQSRETNDLLFKKVHDKYYFVDEFTPLFPAEISKGVIYIIRNPLDVIVSFAYHSAKSIEEMLPVLNNPEYAFCSQKNKLHNQLRQILGSWSDHVKSWTEQKDIPVRVIRYEDMISNTFNTFNQALKFLDINKSDQEITTAIQKSDFGVLSKQEKEEGFKEKMIKSTSFFRKGEINDWKNHLNEEMKNEIISANKDVMMKFGYIDSNNQLIF